MTGVFLKNELKYVVNGLSPAPKARRQSAWRISSEAAGVENVPQMPMLYGSSLKKDCARRVVASTAPVSSPKRFSAGAASDNTAPRPARMTGRLIAHVS